MEKFVIDVSSHQGGNTLTGKMIPYGVIIRTSDTLYDDVYLEYNLRQFKDKYKIALYHYFRFNYNVEYHLKNLLSQYNKAVKILGYSPNIALDVEDAVGLNIVGNATAINRLFDFTHKLEKAIDGDIFIYTAKYYVWDTLFKFPYKTLKKTEFNYLTSFKLWVASYVHNPSKTTLTVKEVYDWMVKIENGEKEPLLPSGWNDYAIWQFGVASGIVSNVRVDVNYLKDKTIFDTPGINPPQPPVEECPCEERIRRIEKELGIA